MTRLPPLLALSWLVLAPSLGAQAARAAPPPVVLESFDFARAFAAVPSDGVALALRPDSGVVGRALRMEFDFQGHAGYAVARRAFALPTLPSHFAITLWVRGEARRNTLELKLVDTTGQNVWWMRKPELVVRGEWTQLRFRSTELSFAWGPLGGGAPRGIGALEVAFTAGQGGRGWLDLDELALVPLAAPVGERVRPRVSASSGASPARVIGRDFFAAPVGPVGSAAGASGWRSRGDGQQSLTLDFGGTRQLSALVLDWSDSDWAVDYDIERSDDGSRWTLARAVRGSAGGRRFVHLPLAETGSLRIAMRRSSRGRGYALSSLRVLSDSLAGTRSAFLERVAQGSAPGLWPRGLTRQQSYWTVVGLPRDERDALVSEDGSVESRPGGFSVEPFLVEGGRVMSWRDGAASHSLDGGWRPIPTVRRTTAALSLGITAFASGTPERSVVWVRYRVVNHASRVRELTLVAAVRPVQVNPPWQFLGVPGGAAYVGTLSVRGDTLVVNDTDRVVGVTPPGSVALARFDTGGVVARMSPRTSDSECRGLPSLRRGQTPATDSGSRHSRLRRWCGMTDLTDSTGFAEAAMRWPLRLAARDSADVWLALPDPASPTITPLGTGDARLAESRAAWDAELGALRVDLPGEGQRLAATLRSALAYVLINARGPAIQPGTRSYRRSWIRDGALTSSALMRLGHTADARAFLDWYIPHVFADGKVPCCVDARGSDPVTENDADGELLYLAAEYLRMTGDSAAVNRHWPVLSKVAAHLDSLRRTRRTARYRTPDSLLVFGLLPPSISHEGYSAKPAYSYWDDWWGVRGLADASLLARTAGDANASARYATAAREMRADVVASVARSMQKFHLQTLPGAAELGDTDPTSSTIALEPAQALGDLPRSAVTATFDSAWATLQRRIAPGSRWEVFVPYEWRDVGAYLRLGQPERADAYSRWLMESQRPREWNEWSEAVYRELRKPVFIGDMPHGWVLSDFVRATLDRIAYEREGDSVLVVGAGIPYAWASCHPARATAPCRPAPAAGVTVSGMHTWWGTLSLTMRPIGDRVRIEITGVTPPGGIELHAPFGRTPRGFTVNGHPAESSNGGGTVKLSAPAVVEISY